MTDSLDQQADRLNDYLARIGIRLSPQRTREALQHALGTAAQAPMQPQDEILPNEIDQWAARFGVEPDALTEAILVVGRQASTVERYLKTGSAFRTRPASAAS